MSMSTKNNAHTSSSRDPERIKEPFPRNPVHQLIEERMTANLGPLKEQISILIQLLNQLI